MNGAEASIRKFMTISSSEERPSAGRQIAYE